MPTHELLGPGTIGLILVLRFLGGIFVAGEYSAAIPLAMEWSAPRRRGLMSGLILSMAPWAQASIAFAVAGLLVVFGPDRYAEFGWRLLFGIGALLSLGMLLYYRSRVSDAPVFHRTKLAEGAATDPTPESAGAAGPVSSRAEQVGVRAVFAGRWARAFWQVFLLMSGLWLLTNTTVILLTSRLATDAGLPATQVSIAMGVASVFQALAMAVAGHLSTLAGRRRLFVIWGTVAAVLGPFLWYLAVTSPSVGRAALFAALLQVATVAAYGPVAAYLSERFPTRVRSTGYGMGYSLSLIIPALHPFYLPLLESAFGSRLAVLGMVAVGGLLVVIGALLGPRLGRTDIDADIDTVAEGQLP
jgi:MFS family permease